MVDVSEIVLSILYMLFELKQKIKFNKNKNPLSCDKGFGFEIILSAPNRINMRFVRAEIISWRTEERDVQPLSRTSFFPSFWGHELRSLPS